AGDVHKIAPRAAVYGRAYKAAMATDGVMAAPMTEKAFDEFHLYSLERPTTLRARETKQVEFVAATGVRAQRIYGYNGAAMDRYGYYAPDQLVEDPSYGTQSNPNIWVMQEFKN